MEKDITAFKRILDFHFEGFADNTEDAIITTFEKLLQLKSLTLDKLSVFCSMASPHIPLQLPERRNPTTKANCLEIAVVAFYWLDFSNANYIRLTAETVRRSFVNANPNLLSLLKKANEAP